MLTEMLRRAVARDPRKTAIVQGPRRIRYSELEELVGRCVAGLKRLGVKKGDCVAVALPNCPEFVVGLFACARLRAVMLPLDPKHPREELLRCVADAQAGFVITDTARDRFFAGVKSTVTGFDALLDVADVARLGRPPPTSDEFSREEGTYAGRALYLYTSGSAGSRKRLCCTQENLHFEAFNFVETMGLASEDNILCTIPLHHSYGLGNCLLDAVYAGSTLVLLEPDGAPFASRAARVFELIRAEAIRFYPGVPYQFQVLATLPDAPRPDLAGLTLCVSSGDVLPDRTYRRFLERYGLSIRSLYGSTEAGSIAINTDPVGQIEAGSLGPPLRNVAIEIRDAAGQQLPAGEEGEIWVKSPTMPPNGYDDSSDLVHEAYRAGFYNTGDIGRWNHRGHLILAGRKQTFVDIAGNKVNTSEVEDVLECCPGVREAAVLGVEVPRMGTLVKAAVVTEGPCQPAEIREYCRQRLAFYKVPRLIEAYPSLPRNELGKVLKSELGGIKAYLEEIRNAEATRIIGQLPTISPDRRRSLMTKFVQAQVAAVLGRPVETLPRNVGFIELGMDSFGAIELNARLEYLFDQKLPQTFTFDHPTIDAVTENLRGLLEKS